MKNNGGQARALACLFLLALCAGSAAWGTGPDTGTPAVLVFPPTDQLFQRLLADPRQARTTGRYYQQGEFHLADISLGDSWGMVRWGMGDWKAQWNVEGMAYSRFRLTGGINEFQTIDFFGNLPVELRRGRFSGRVTLFHESSHLGDDYIRRTNDLGFRYSVEGIRGVGSWDAHPFLRLYGGGVGMIHSVPRRQSGEVQAGFEARGSDLHWITRHPCYLYLAQDLQFKGRTKWNPNSNTELGLRIAYSGALRSIRVHGSYFGGHSEFGQFFSRLENRFDFGITLDF